jgi:hypothetical protein
MIVIQHPLGLPEGSIRALLTIGVVAFSCLMIYEGRWVEMPESFQMATIGILVAYFGMRHFRVKEEIENQVEAQPLPPVFENNGAAVTEFVEETGEIPQPLIQPEIIIEETPPKNNDNTTTS